MWGLCARDLARGNNSERRNDEIDEQSVVGYGRVCTADGHGDSLSDVGERSKKRCRLNAGCGDQSVPRAWGQD